MTELGGGVAWSGRLVYGPAITDRILNTGTLVSFNLQAGGYDTLVAPRAKAARGQQLTDEGGRRLTLEAPYDMKIEFFDGHRRDGMQPRLVISSDAGPFDISVGALQYGLELAVTGGMSPTAAADEATRIAAEACGVEDRVGTIRSGAMATR